MKAHTKTEQVGLSGELHNLGIINLSDFDRIEDIFQIRLAITDLTRKISTADSCRMSAVIELSHAMATLETAQDLIRTAHTN
jgi:hypothetical protein